MFNRTLLHYLEVTVSRLPEAEADLRDPSRIEDILFKEQLGTTLVVDFDLNRENHGDFIVGI
jgi:hypothetical protein